MTIERAIEILDPEHRVPCDSLKTVQEACRMGVEALRVAENHGLTIEGLDYALRQYQIVICEITHGMMSKLTYDAKDIIRIAQDRWCDTCDLKETIPLTGDEAESIISFIKGHEREDIPDEVWDICMRLCDETERV